MIAYFATAISLSGVLKNFNVIYTAGASSIDLEKPKVIKYLSDIMFNRYLQ